MCISKAKVPIVKIWDPELGMACDMNVNNTTALENTRMIRTYVEADPRVRQLMMVIKYWTRRRVINDAGLSLPSSVGARQLTRPSTRRHFELLHMDLHDHCLLTASDPARVAHAACPSLQETSPKWRDQ